MSKDLGISILSDLTVFSKYAKYKPELKRRETWNEVVDRYENMMCTKYPTPLPPNNRNMASAKLWK